MKDITRCESCGSNNVKPKNISFWHMGKVVTGVPAIVCMDCGEEMLTSDVLGEVERLAQAGIYTYQNGGNSDARARA